MTSPRDGDRLVWPILWHLQQCVAYQLGFIGRPVCYFPIYWHSQNPPADSCDCTCDDDGGQGQAWVRLVRLEGNSSMSSRFVNCANGVHDLTVELGVYRCSPAPTDRNGVPEAEETAHAAGMYRDAEALRRALRCCTQLQKRGVEPVLREESAIGPSGACVGVRLQSAILGVADCACPDDEQRTTT